MSIIAGMVLSLTVMLLTVVYTRRRLLSRHIPAAALTEPDTEVYPVGAGYLIRRSGLTPGRTVIVVPGLLENPGYFTGYYQSPDLELIMLSATGYHPPCSTANARSAAWCSIPSLPCGTIAADAQLLNLALEHLVSTTDVRVHGHSRGAAVVLEAAQQRPDLFDSLEVILEAPLLPQGQPAIPSTRLGNWLLPLFHLLWQRSPRLLLKRPIWGPLQSPGKRAMLLNLPFNVRSSQVLLTNLQDLAQWMTVTGPEIYRHVKRGAVLIPEEDRILRPQAMLNSAHRAENLQLIRVTASSHFVLQDHPESIPPLNGS